jgi:catechol 2,3-dioxygenase-like lactoylglutathione lyase family enzyme
MRNADASDSPSTGPPRRFNHVGVAVDNLDDAIEFYKVFLQTEPVAYFETEGDKHFLNELIGYDSSVMREAMLPLGDGFIELLEYTRPDRTRTNPDTYNVGHMHFCVDVEDIQAEYERLRDADIGIEFRSNGPIAVPDSEPDFAGEKSLYLRTPDGTTFELYQQLPQ